MASYTRKIQVPGKSSQELYDKISADIDGFLAKTGMGKVVVERDAAKKEVRIKSSMLTATLACQEGGINLDGKLSLLASPFRGKIDAGIDKWLAKTFKITV